MQSLSPLPARRSWQPVISVVVPAFNEAAGLEMFHRRLSRAMSGVEDWEVIYVNDGSTDATLLMMEALRRTDDRVALISLSRNFGKEVAITAGLDHAAGDAVVVIDADLQDPPELIPELIASWRAGFDMVYAKRRSRAGESWLKRRNREALLPTDAAHGRPQAARGHRRFPPHEPPGRRRRAPVARAAPVHERAVRLGRLSDHLRALRSRAQMRRRQQVVVLETVEPGAGGHHQLHRHAAEMRHLCRPGRGSAVGDLRRAGDREDADHRQPGGRLPSLMTVVLFLGGVQLMFLGVIGEYLGRVFNETKQRPLYLVERFVPSAVKVSL